MQYDIIILGAGAAGLMAASRGAECGQKVLLLEKNSRAGVKIVMSGGTRCNVTHHTDAQGIVEAFGPKGRFLHSALAALAPEDLLRLLADEGVPTQTEASGKIFPVSNRAIDVRNALLRRATRAGVTFALNEPARQASSSDELFLVRTDSRTLAASKLIVTTGGKSYPGCGTTGDGYAWARAWGHTVVPPRPALTPITSDAAWIASLQGITLPDVLLRVPMTSGNRGQDPPRGTRRGSLLFTHFGLSGPAAMDISRELTRHNTPMPHQVACNFTPDIHEESLRGQIVNAARSHPRQSAMALLAQFVPRRLAAALCSLAGIQPDARCAHLSKRQLAAMGGQLKTTQLPISGTRGFKKAEVTAGGVALDEVDSRTMGSKRVERLYFAGEILDLDGPIGGYNFQAAFSTGWLAGTAAAG